MAAWNDGKTKPHVARAAEEIRDKFAIFDIGGYRSGPDAQDHGLGLAIDVMTTIKGNAVSAWALANAARLNITYVIWSRRIWDSRNTRGWEPYRGSSPHTDHVHISFHPTPSSGGDAVDTATGELGQNEGCLGFILRLFGASFPTAPDDADQKGKELFT
jgi:hypothetical protein